MGKEDSAPNEWPPSPLRLFQAIVAGAGARWAGDEGSTRAALTAEAPVAALKWLESLCASVPPTILAPRAVTGQAVPRYVPNNSADVVAARWARGDALATFEDRTKKIFRPTHLLDGQTVHYLWALDETREHEARSHAPVLAAAARCIVALGWGIDAAIGDARIMDASHVASLPGERWEPGRLGTAGLRLPTSGTLDALVRRHAAFLDRLKDDVFRPVPPVRQFTTAAYRRATDLPPRLFAAFALRPLDPDTTTPWHPQHRAVCVAAMLRHATWQAAKDDLEEDLQGQLLPGAWRTQEWAEHFVAGHGPRKQNGRYVDESWPRFSYLPLPSLTPIGAGDIRRVLIAEPFGSDGRAAEWARLRLAGMHLTDERTRQPVAVLEPLTMADTVLRRYVGEPAGHNEWASVTPVILPGYDDNKRAKRECLLRECLRHAGLDEAAVESMDSRPVSWFPRVPLHAQFKRPTYLGHLPALHVRLRFHEPVCGPLSLGAGRHCGLGVFATTSR